MGCKKKTESFLTGNDEDQHRQYKLRSSGSAKSANIAAHIGQGRGGQPGVRCRTEVKVEEVMPDFLEKILEVKHTEVAAAKSGISPDLMKAKAAKASAPRGFAKAMRSMVENGGPAVIAEIKRASPSKGIISKEFYPSRIAKDYEANGATCLSVLTDTSFFQGSADVLRAARAACSIPVLRKDFIIDPYQIYSSRAIGADAVLLIVRALTDEQALALCNLAQKLGMDVLVEAHDAEEIERALKLPTPLIGINNRNLRTFETDIAVTLDLMDRVPEDRIIVTESGVMTAHDVRTLREAGVQGFLVGEVLMRESSPGSVLKRIFFS